MGNITKIAIITLLLTLFTKAYEIGPKNFNKIIKSHKLVLVDFWQPNCPGCQMLEPNLNKAKRVLGKSVLIVKYNVRQLGDPVYTYQIQTTPTMILFKNGYEVDRNYMLGYKDIISWINKYK